MTATNHDDQLSQIYPTILNKLNCTFGVSFSRCYCCGRHGHGLWCHGIPRLAGDRKDSAIQYSK